MNVHLITADRMTQAERTAWAEIQRSEPAFESPYFRPEFTAAVATVRDDVEIGVVEENAVPVGFFPFQRSRGNVARPVGGIMSDYQGIIARPNVAWNPRDLLRGCRLSAWHFDHLIAAQDAFHRYHAATAESPYIDLSDGWEGYKTEQLTLHSDSYLQAEARRRQAQREAGPLRVEVNTADPAIFRQLLRWKSEQYRRNGLTDVVGFPWTAALLQRIAAMEGDDFSGMVSALYMGSVPTAILLSMRCRDVMHAWISTYRPSFSPLSPGIVLWHELLRILPQIGIRRIDLGKGSETYKQQLMSGATVVAEGSVDLRPVSRVARNQWRRTYQWARRTPMRRPLLAPGRFIRTWIESRSFR
jgi:CelD/BcsL family acetyltransferase involved in cellulose biosynthesis